MIACLDVAYRMNGATAACVLIEDWSASSAVAEFTHPCGSAADYEPGRFYRRELPCLREILRVVSRPVDVVVVDGYVWLSAEGAKGLGAHLYDALSGAVTVVGVAKTPYKGAPAVAITRGRSRVPLFVTAAGMPAAIAAAHVQQMHGTFRIPSMLKRVDQLSRLGARAPGVSG